MKKTASNFMWDYMCNILSGKLDVLFVSEDDDVNTDVTCSYIERNVDVLVLSRYRPLKQKRPS
mgnify:CR=1 FL=1